MIESITDTVHKAKNGDKQAFTTLYGYYYKDMYRYALYSLRNSHDSEDVISETIVDAFVGIANLQKEASFKMWLFKILSAKIKRKLKQYATKKTSPIEDEILVAPESNREEAMDLQRALSLLEEESRMIVTLSVVGDYTSKEIAQMLQLNASTVRTKLARSLKKLQTILTDPVPATDERGDSLVK